MPLVLNGVESQGLAKVLNHPVLLRRSFGSGELESYQHSDVDACAKVADSNPSQELSSVVSLPACDRVVLEVIRLEFSAIPVRRSCS